VGDAGLEDEQTAPRAEEPPPPPDQEEDDPAYDPNEDEYLKSGSEAVEELATLQWGAL